MRRLFRIETLFALGMWAVSLALAFFLMGLGSLIVADLPRVADPVPLDAFLDQAAAERVRAERAGLTSRTAALLAQADDAALALAAAEADVAQRRGNLEAIVAARTATGDQTRNETVLAATSQLEAVRAAERQARENLASLAAGQTDVRERSSALERELSALYAAAEPRWQGAVFVAELRVFLLRLALTLPLLGLALWAIRTRANSPLWRGFILFAAYAFFFELVPYLPSYGGYVHYGVGVVTTLLLGAWLIRAARRHLARRVVAAQQSEAERRRRIAYDEALEKTAKSVCPSCERTLRTTDATPINFCVHCGLKLFEPCPSCGVRRLVFFPFCMSCGTAAAAEPPARPGG